MRVSRGAGHACPMRARSVVALTLVGLAFVACAAFDSADSAEETGPSFDAGAGATGDGAPSSDSGTEPSSDSGEGGAPEGGNEVYGDERENAVACGVSSGSCIKPDQFCCASAETGCLRSSSASGCISGVPLTCDGDEDCSPERCIAVVADSQIRNTRCVTTDEASRPEFRRTCHSASDCADAGAGGCVPIQCGDVTFGVCAKASGQEDNLTCNGIVKAPALR